MTRRLQPPALPLLAAAAMVLLASPLRSAGAAGCRKVAVDDVASKVPDKEVPAGESCGAGIATCAPGLCCGQDGFCSDSAIACDGTCQCAYSGKGSACAGGYPVAPKSTLRTARSGGACGPFVAKCPGTQCCTMFGICSSNAFHCASPSCFLKSSPGSTLCKAAHKAYPRGRNPKHYEINATVGAFSPDGNFTRDVILVNGKWGELLIEAEVGQRVIVTFNNQVPLASGDSSNMGASIHWHGMLQMNNNQEDGVVQVTQRLVAPGESYTYSFVPDTPGTFWWHSHFKAQYIDGLRGQLIVKDPTHMVTWTTDTTMVLADFYRAPWSDLVNFYLSPASNGEEPTPRNGVVNGISQDDCLYTDPKTCKYAFIKATAGTCDNPQTRLRILNSGGFAVFDVSIDHHRMMVIQVDAVGVEPVWVNTVRINNGQRVDVMLCRDDNTTNTEPVWVRASMPDDTFTEDAEYNATLAILYYTNAPPTPAEFPPSALAQQMPPEGTGPDSGDPSSDLLNLEVFHGPGQPPIRPPPSTMSVNRTLAFQVTGGTQYGFFDSISLEETGTPSLLERIYGNPEGVGVPSNPSGPGLQRGWNIVNITGGSVVDIYINNQDEGEHPLHLHGAWFWIMARGNDGDGDYAGQPLNMGKLARDTETVDPSSYIVLRFIANNPGVWMFHCHIDWHLAAGLGWVFRVIV